MSIKYITGEDTEGLPLSDAVVAGDFAFISGLVGFGPDGEIVKGGVGAETDTIFLILSDILRKSGATLNDLVKVTVYLVDAADFDAFNAAYRRYFPQKFPARIGVVSGLTIDARVEMDFVAYTGD